MNILTMENVSKGFLEKNLFENISMGIDSSDRIGLVGVNGIGKTTFLKLVSGELLPDSGRIIKGNDIRIKFLSQSPIFNEDLSVIENILQGDSPEIKTIRQYEEVAGRLDKNKDDKKLQSRLVKLSAEMDLLDVWSIEAQAKSILSKLGIDEIYKKISELSGGQRKRVALAEALIQPAELLVLDEPTNHIDLETISWLESFLLQRKGALLMVTHDRYFLNRLVNRIIEIDRKKLHFYNGNFEYFLEKKTRQEEVLAAAEQKRRRLYLDELAWICRGAKARTTKQKARIQRFESIKNLEIKMPQSHIEIPVAYTRLGKKVVEINNVSKSFNGNFVIKDFNMIISPDERIGIVGANGAGKTTLLNLLAGVFSPDSGTIDIGETVKIAYYRQENAELEFDIKAIDYIRKSAEYVKTEEGKILSAGRMLEQFLFDDSKQYSLIKTLSGGEKRRLLLAKILMERPNVLLLDEPTNDLDIQTLEVLEEYLSYYKGVALISSHDRYFLEKTTDKLIAINIGGKIDFFTSVESYNKSLLAGSFNKSLKPHFGKVIPKGIPDIKNLSVKTKTKSQENTGQAPAASKPKFTYNETREFEVIDKEIGQLEKNLEKILNEMQSCWSDHEKIKELGKKHEELQEKLGKKMDRWVYLNEKAEQLKQYSNR